MATTRTPITIGFLTLRMPATILGLNFQKQTETRFCLVQRLTMKLHVHPPKHLPVVTSARSEHRDSVTVSHVADLRGMSNHRQN